MSELVAGEIEDIRDEGGSVPVAHNVLAKLHEGANRAEAMRETFCAKHYLTADLVYIRAFATKAQRLDFIETSAGRWIALLGTYPSGLYEEQGQPANYTLRWLQDPLGFGK